MMFHDVKQQQFTNVVKPRIKLDVLDSRAGVLAMELRDVLVPAGVSAK